MILKIKETRRVSLIITKMSNRTKLINFTVTKEEEELLRKAAGLLGLTYTSLIRAAALQNARKVIKDNYQKLEGSS